MALPTYKRGAVEAPSVTSQTTGMAEGAESGAYAQIADALGNQANAQKQTTNLYHQDLNSRLNDFDQYANKTAQNVNQSLGIIGASEANKDLDKRRHEINQIKQDPNLTQEIKDLSIDMLSRDLSSDYVTAYGAAYNTTMKADYSNSIALDVYEKVTYASNTASGDPETFKTLYNEYVNEAMALAPDDATRLIAQRAYDKGGLNEFEKLFKIKDAKYKKRATENSAVLLQKLERDFLNTTTDESRGGPIGKAAEYVAKIGAIVDADVVAGRYSKEKGDWYMEKLKNKAEVITYTGEFDQKVGTGNDIAVYTSYNGAKKAGALGHWAVSDHNALKSHMETSLARTAKNQVTEIDEQMKIGIPPTKQQLANIEVYKDFIPTAQRDSLIEYQNLIGILDDSNKKPIDQSIAELEDSKRTLTEASDIAATDKAIGLLKKRKTAAGKDPIEYSKSHPATAQIKIGELPLDDLTDPLLRASLQKRIADADFVNKTYNTQDAAQIFTNAELQTVSDNLLSLSPDDRVEALYNIVGPLKGTSYEKQLKIDLDKIDKDLGNTIYILQENNNINPNDRVEVSKKVYQGSKLKDTALGTTYKMESQKVRIALAGYSDEDKDRIMGMVDDYYKSAVQIDYDLAAVKATGTEGDEFKLDGSDRNSYLSKKRLNEAISKVIGPVYDGTVAPHGVSETKWGYFKQHLTDSDYSFQVAPIKVQETSFAMEFDGKDSQEVYKNMLNDSQLIHIGGNKYRAYNISNGKYLVTPGGKPYIIEYQDMPDPERGN